MSDFIFPCPKCSKDIQCDDSYAGMSINCPICQAPIVVPRPGAPPPAPSGRPGATGRTAYQPMQNVAATQKSGGLKKVLTAVVVLVVLAALGAGGWYFYNQHKKSLAAQGNPAAQVAEPTATSSAGAVNLLTKMHDAYASLPTLSAQGSVVMAIDMSGVTAADMNPNTKNKAAASKRPSGMPKAVTNLADVSIKLSKPNKYLISGNMKTEMGPVAMTNVAAAWSAGDTNYLLMVMAGGVYKNFTTVKDRNQAMMMNGQGGLLAMGIPLLFFDDTGMMTKFISEWGQGADESVDGTACNTITGKMLGQKLKMWVNKDNSLIVKAELTLGGAVSDADLDAIAAMAGSSGKMTAAQTAQMKTQLKQGAAMVTKIKGTITETYESYETNNTFSATDFEYPVPRGTRLTPGMM